MSRRLVSPSYSDMQPIVLYDLKATNANASSWAPNIWRIRFILNFKRLPFRIVPLDIHEVEPQLRSIGAPPTCLRQGKPVYTLPVLVDANGPGTHANGHGYANGHHRAPRIISNENIIAEYLESTYPARPVFPDGSRAMQTLFVHYIQESFMKPLVPILVPMSHPQYHPGGGHPGNGANGTAGPQLDEAWRHVKYQFDTLGSILDKNSMPDMTGCPVAQGRDLTYADFAMCSVLLWIRQVAPREAWAQVKNWNNGRWKKLYERCKEYMD